MGDVVFTVLLKKSGEEGEGKYLCCSTCYAWYISSAHDFFKVTIVKTLGFAVVFLLYIPSRENCLIGSKTHLG